MPDAPAPNPQSPTPNPLLVASSPHLRQSATSQRIMLEVAIALLPAVAMAIYNFRLNALAILIACVGAALITEAIFNRVRRLDQTALDGSALVTGIILALSVPPTLPIWMAVVGAVVAIAIGKMVFGGLGANILNPAMVGRAFLVASFGVYMSNYTTPVPDRAPIVAQAQQSEIDAITQATPLGQYKAALKAAAKDPESLQPQQDVQQLEAQLEDVFTGVIPGSLGETSALMVLIGGAFLLLRRTITWHIPTAMLATAALISAIAWLLNPDLNLNPLYHLSAGSLLFGAFFIATDPVSCPLSRTGRLLFGAGAGAIVMLIRLYGGYPEGVMFAILFMNALTPLLDRWTRPTPTGGHTPKPA